MTPEKILKKYNNISKDDLASIFKEGILSVFAKGISQVGKNEKPQAIILGGQPGSGKTELIERAKQMFSHNVVVCNADDFRPFHPDHDAIIKESPHYYPDITREYAMLWNKMLKEYCEKKRLSYILETTFSSGVMMKDTIRKIKAKGYSVTIMILAVHEKISFLNTLSRYEDMLEKTNYGRVVGKDAHDERYQKIPGTIELVQTQKLYDRIYIFGRAGLQNVLGKKMGLVLISDNKKNPLKFYLAERDKKWSDNDNKYFKQEASLLAKRLKKRNASIDELSAFLTDTDFSSRKKRHKQRK